MGAWEIFINAVGLVAIALFFVGLQWAATERGKAHREWAVRREEATETRPVVDWCVALGAVAGWV
jgi:hypothetical protein